MHIRKSGFVAVLIAGATLVSGLMGCAVRVSPAPVVVAAPAPREEVIIRQAPPPMQEEVIVEAPSPRHAWVAGHWAWHGEWVWVPGHWAVRPHPHAAWVPGHWQHHGGGWVWVSGYWR